VIHDDAKRMLAAGAVLDDLAPDERASYEAHRDACVDCRLLEQELDRVMADLSLVVPERMPPPDLLSGIRRALGADAAADGAQPIEFRPSRSAIPSAEDGAAAPLATVNPGRRSPRVPTVASLALAAAFGIIAIGLGARALSLQQDLDLTSAQVASLESALAQRGDAVTVAVNPLHVTVALHGDALAPQAEAAVMFVPGQDAAYLVARNLPATPAGHGYQLWYADAAGVHPLQTVSYDGSGPFVAPIGVDLAGSAAVMITLEESGGATGEPGPQVVFGEL
jgi:hypothetical protein